jgi:hypothetical protein
MKFRKEDLQLLDHLALIVGMAPKFSEVIVGNKTIYKRSVEQVLIFCKKVSINAMFKPIFAIWPIHPRVFKDSVTGESTLLGFDLPFLTGKKREDGKDIINMVRVLEQNPNKMDQFGNLKTTALNARRGHKILWVINQDANEFVGRFQDGQFFQSKPKVAETNTAKNAQAPWETYNFDDLPDVDVHDVHDYVIHTSV